MAFTELARQYTHAGRPLDTNITWPLGNTGVWQRLTLFLEYRVAIDFTTSSSLFMEEPNIFELTDGTTWNKKGFQVGDTFRLDWTKTDINTNQTTPFNVTGTIIFINDSQMLSSNTTLGQGAMASNIYPTQLADNKIHSVFIVKTNDAPPEAINFAYNHLTNTAVQSFSLNSFIDGNETQFTIDDVELMTNGQTRNFTFLGNQSGMSIATCQLTFIGKNGRRYVYAIDVVFMFFPFEDITSYQTNTPPPQTIGAESITDAYFVEGRPTNNNPNVVVTNDQSLTDRLGNVGWFDENFDGQPNVFTVSSVNYFNLAALPVQALDYQNPIKVVAVIDGVPNISGQTACMFGFQWVPTEESDWKDLPDPFFENTKMSTGGDVLNFGDVFTVSNVIDAALRTGYSSDGASMDVRNIRFQNTGVDQITFEAEFVPNAAFAAFMDARDETERNYILWISVADQTEVTNDSNRVSLRFEPLNTMQTFIAPIGPYPGMTIGFLDHVQSEIDVPNSCGVDMRIEDGILSKVLFTVDTSVSPTNPIPTGLTFGIKIERDSDGASYLLEEYAANLRPFPDPTQYNFQESRGFHLGVNDDKNFVKVLHEPALDVGVVKGVLGLYGWKVRWEDWIPRTNVPQFVIDDFYDNTLKSNGIGNNWFRYLGVPNWRMYFVVFLDAQLDGVAVRYENKRQMIFKDYDVNPIITTVFTYRRESDLSVLNGGVDPESGLPLGVILNNELVRIECVFTRSSGVFALANLYGIITIEVREGGGSPDYRALSSVKPPENDNPLEGPVTIQLELTLVSPTEVRGTALVNPLKLIETTDYKISARLGCKP